MAIPLRKPNTLGAALARAGVGVDRFCAEVGVARSCLYQYANGQLPRKDPQAVFERIAAGLARWGVDPAVAPWLNGPSDSTPPRRPTGAHLRLVAGDEGSQQPPTTPPDQEDNKVITREFLTQAELQAFSLPEDPFEDAENPEDVFLSRRVQALELAVQTSIRRRRILAVVGEAGSGKSTLIRRIWGMASRNKQIRLIAPATIDRSAITAASLANAIVRDLTGEDTGAWSNERRSDALRKALDEHNTQGICPALIIDEAHLLTLDALLAIKHVWDSHLLFRQIAVVLVGQPPLALRLRQDTRIRELAGRCQIVEIEPLQPAEVGEYLAWRFNRIGASAESVFEPSVYPALVARAQSLLFINNLTVLAIRYAVSHGAGKKRVTDIHVARV